MGQARYSVYANIRLLYPWENDALSPQALTFLLVPGLSLWFGSSEPCVSHYHPWFAMAKPARPDPAHKSYSLVTFVL